MPPRSPRCSQWRLRTLASLLIAAASVTSGLVIASAPTQALASHARLVSVTPTDGATLAEAPAAVALTFNEDIAAVGVQVTVTRNGTAHTEDKPVIDGPTVTQRLSGSPPAGNYLVTYRVVSTDGHPISGKTTFAVATATPTVSTTPTSPTTPSEPSSPAAASDTATQPPPTRASDQQSVLSGDPTPFNPYPLLVIAGVLIAVGIALSLARRRSQRER